MLHHQVFSSVELRLQVLRIVREGEANEIFENQLLVGWVIPSENLVIHEGDLEENDLVGNRQRGLHVEEPSEVVLHGVCASRVAVYRLGWKCLQSARFRLVFVSPLTMTALRLHSGLVLLTDGFASNQPSVSAVEAILTKKLRY